MCFIDPAAVFHFNVIKICGLLDSLGSLDLFEMEYCSTQSYTVWTEVHFALLFTNTRNNTRRWLFCLFGVSLHQMIPLFRLFSY